MMNPKGAFSKAWRAIIRNAAPRLPGILSKILLNMNTIKPSARVRTDMLIIPSKGVQMKNLPYKRAER